MCDGGSAECTIGGYPGYQTCKSDCTGLSECIASDYCGDKVANGPEICDWYPGHCTVGSYPGLQPCNPDCAGYGACTSSDYCGDGKVSGPEVCDGEGLKPCYLNGYAGTRLCHADCTADPCVTTEYCGDGILQFFEECDDGNGESGDGCDSACKLEVRWTAKVEREPVGMADDGKGKLHVITYDGDFESLDTATGASLLKAKNNFHFTTGPLQLPGGLLVAGTEEGRSAVIQPLVGLTLHNPLHDSAILAPPVSLDGDDYLVATVSGEISSNGPSSPTVNWKVQTGQFVFVPPVVDAAGNFYIAGQNVTDTGQIQDGILSSYKGEDGAFRWMRTLEESQTEHILTGLVLSGSFLLVTATDSTFLVNANDGSTVWTLPRGGDLPVIDDGGRAYIVGSEGVFCIDLAAGEIVWDTSPSYHSGVLAMGMTIGRKADGDILILGMIDPYTLYSARSIQSALVPTNSSGVMAFGVESGEVVWKKGIVPLLTTGPLLTEDGTIYLSDENGYITALDSGGAEPCTDCAWPEQSRSWLPNRGIIIFNR